MKIYLISTYFILIGLFFVGCESKPKQAQEIQSTMIEKKTEILKADNYETCYK